MPIRPRLIRSIPFWVLVLASAGTIAAGAYILSDRLVTMTTTLNAGTATGVDVYVGQSVALLGAVLIGAGATGILLALGIAAAATLRPVHPVEAAQPVDREAEPLERDASLDAELDTAADEASVADREAVASPR